MKNKMLRKTAMFAVVLFLIGWPLYQTIGMFSDRKEEHDASHLLYQVSLFQIELLNSCLGEAGKAKSTGELDACRQTLYSAGYTHERLVLAAGGNGYLTTLDSVPQLMQYVQRLQIGGERKLKADEVQTLQAAAAKFQQIYEVYEKLMASGGGVIASQNEKLISLDKSLAELVRKKLLE